MISLVSLIDNRTLIGCQLLTNIVFSLVFLGMKRMHPHLRGAGTFSLAFASGGIGCCLFVARGSISDLLSVALANCLILSAFALLYCGILRFFRSSRKTHFIWGIIALATLLLAYYAVVDNQIVARIVIAEIALFPIQSLMAAELFRKASGRLLLKIFGTLMALYALLGAVRIFLTLLHGSPVNFMHGDPVQTSVLALNTIFACAIGLCLLGMLSGELMDVLENQSFEDPVANALNRRGIEQKLAIELGSAKRSRMAPSIALIDIDHFKDINDTLGHAAGDKAIRQVAHAISSHLRDYDYLGRYGGDEFLLVLPQASYQDALKAVERIQQAIRSLPQLRPDLPITLSIGVTQAVPFESADVILTRADAALYEAKRAGRNCCRVIPPTGDIEIPAAVTAPNSPS